jgi:hypothetical protein
MQPSQQATRKSFGKLACQGLPCRFHLEPIKSEGSACVDYYVGTQADVTQLMEQGGAACIAAVSAYLAWRACIPCAGCCWSFRTGVSAVAPCGTRRSKERHQITGDIAHAAFQCCQAAVPVPSQFQARPIISAAAGTDCRRWLARRQRMLGRSAVFYASTGGTLGRRRQRVRLTRACRPPCSARWARSRSARS